MTSLDINGVGMSQKSRITTEKILAADASCVVEGAECRCFVSRQADEKLGLRLFSQGGSTEECISKILSVASGGPADRAGLRSGDHILEVSNESVSGMLHADVINLFSSAGSEFFVTVARGQDADNVALPGEIADESDTHGSRCRDPDLKVMHAYVPLPAQFVCGKIPCSLHLEPRHASESLGFVHPRESFTVTAMQGPWLLADHTPPDTCVSRCPHQAILFCQVFTSCVSLLLVVSVTMLTFRNYTQCLCAERVDLFGRCGRSTGDAGAHRYHVPVAASTGICTLRQYIAASAERAVRIKSSRIPRVAV
eukprot:m.385196 g.385196  ORF g.385196 m.385196 type:complete len:310 (-) comp21004_c0_seq10:302-1231(-)